MSAVYEKIKRLEKYLAADAQTDPVVEQTVDKLLQRETTRLTEMRTRLEIQQGEFETRHGMKSADFYERFERGELGDAMDFVEWSATYEMIANLDKRLAFLE